MGQSSLYMVYALTHVLCPVVSTIQNSAHCFYVQYVFICLRAFENRTHSYL